MSTFVTLIYHEIIDNYDRSYTVSQNTFQSQMNYLKSEGFTVEGLDGVETRLATHQWPERYVVITFDDGHESNLLAAEILQKSGFNASFLLTKKFSEERHNFLKANDIQTLGHMGHIGSHTLTHANLEKISSEQAEIELRGSKQWLEELTGKAITTLGAPNGSLGDRVAQLAFNCGYTLLSNSVEWWNDVARLSKSRIINRVAIRQSFSMRTFNAIVHQETRFFISRRIRAGALQTMRKLRIMNE